jgi:hypothetical protein
MDPNVTGRFTYPQEMPKDAPDTKLIVALDLTEESDGNGIGIGLADITTRKLFEKVNFHHFYMNALSAGIIAIPEAKIPPVMPTDREAIRTALELLNKRNGEVRVMRVKNTLELSKFQVSEALVGEARSNKALEIAGEPSKMEFSILGDLV